MGHFVFLLDFFLNFFAFPPYFFGFIPFFCLFFSCLFWILKYFVSGKYKFCFSHFFLYFILSQPLMYSRPILCSLVLYYGGLWSDTGKYDPGKISLYQTPFLSHPVMYSYPILCSLVLYYVGLGSDTGKYDLGNISLVSIILSYISF